MKIIAYIIALFTCLFWSIDYWGLLKKKRLFLPKNILWPKKIFLRFFLFSIGFAGWLLMIYSLSYPYKSVGYAQETREVSDIYIVLDVSRSMLADDFNPNRLRASQKKIKEFISYKPVDRLGFIIFSEKVLTMIPLTHDLELIAQAVDEAQIGPLGSGTNIGDALGTAVARLHESQAVSKSIILLTDGVNNIGNLTPIQAAEQAKKLGVRIYTIAVGSDKDAKIPVGDNLFGQRFQLIPGGSIDFKTLTEIAQITQGFFYKAKDESSLKEVFKEIEKLEKTKIDIPLSALKQYTYYTYLIIGILLFLLVEIIRRFILGELL